MILVNAAVQAFSFFSPEKNRRGMTHCGLVAPLQ
jgi:hypothetical protein